MYSDEFETHSEAVLVNALAHIMMIDIDQWEDAKSAARAMQVVAKCALATCGWTSDEGTEECSGGPEESS